MLNPRQVIGWKSKMVDGKVVLTALRIKEVVVEDGDDFGQKKVEQIRYLTPGKVEIYRKSTGAEGQATWALHEEWETSRRTSRWSRSTPSAPVLCAALRRCSTWRC
jgi:hypothetical protein